MRYLLVNDISVDKKLLSEVVSDWSDALKIPVIQRDFVWDAEDVKELLVSIVKGYPIGSIILWETKGKFPSSPLLDSKKNFKTPVPLYVLDGQQRLTALLLAKAGWKISRNGRKIEVESISYNPSNKIFYISEKRGIDVSLLINAGLGVATALEELRSRYHQEYEKAIDDVGRKIINYQLPLYTIKTYTDISKSPDVANEIAEIFTRVNSAGVNLGNIQMFLSFFAAAFSDLKDEIVDRYQELSKKYNEELPTWEVGNRFVFSNVKMTQNQITKIDSFKKAIESLKIQFLKNKTELKNTIRSSYESMDIILDFIYKETGICTSSRLPSQNTLLPLFKWAYINKIDDYKKISQTNKKLMLKWFIIASFRGLYTSYTNRRIEQDFVYIKKGNFPSDLLFKNMQDEIHTTRIDKDSMSLDYYVDVTRGNTGRGYLMLLNTLLFRRNASDWAGHQVKSNSTVIHHIFPREFLKANKIIDRNAINDFANLTLIDPETNGGINDDATTEYLGGFDEKELLSHFIPTDKKLWAINNYDAFLLERSKLIWNGLEQMLKKDLV